MRASVDDEDVLRTRKLAEARLGGKHEDGGPHGGATQTQDKSQTDKYKVLRSLPGYSVGGPLRPSDAVLVSREGSVPFSPEGPEITPGADMRPTLADVMQSGQNSPSRCRWSPNPLVASKDGGGEYLVASGDNESRISRSTSVGELIRRRRKAGSSGARLSLDQQLHSNLLSRGPVASMHDLRKKKINDSQVPSMPRAQAPDKQAFALRVSTTSARAPVEPSVVSRPCSNATAEESPARVDSPVASDGPDAQSQQEAPGGDSEGAVIRPPSAPCEKSFLDAMASEGLMAPSLLADVLRRKREMTTVSQGGYDGMPRPSSTNLLSGRAAVGGAGGAACRRVTSAHDFRKRTSSSKSSASGGTLGSIDERGSNAPSARVAPAASGCCNASWEVSHLGGRPFLGMAPENPLLKAMEMGVSAVTPGGANVAQRRRMSIDQQLHAGLLSRGPVTRANPLLKALAVGKTSNCSRGKAEEPATLDGNGTCSGSEEGNEEQPSDNAAIIGMEKNLSIDQLLYSGMPSRGPVKPENPLLEALAARRAQANLGARDKGLSCPGLGEQNEEQFPTKDVHKLGKRAKSLSIDQLLHSGLLSRGPFAPENSFLKALAIGSTSIRPHDGHEELTREGYHPDSKGPNKEHPSAARLARINAAPAASRPLATARNGAAPIEAFALRRNCINGRGKMSQNDYFAMMPRNVTLHQVGEGGDEVLACSSVANAFWEVADDARPCSKSENPFVMGTAVDDISFTSKPAIDAFNATTQDDSDKETRRLSDPVSSSQLDSCCREQLSLGDRVRDEDMPANDSSEMRTALAVSKLVVGDFAFVWRSDGTWSYARVLSRRARSITFQVNVRGSTKTFNLLNAGKYVRITSNEGGKNVKLVKVPVAMTQSGVEARSRRTSIGRANSEGVECPEHDALVLQACRLSCHKGGDDLRQGVAVTEWTVVNSPQSGAPTFCRRTTMDANDALPRGMLHRRATTTAVGVANDL